MASSTLELEDKTATHEEWVAARKAFLATEMEVPRLRVELSRQRR